MKGNDMKSEQKTRKGFFRMLRESFSKTGGCCCGPGETCCGPGEGSEQRKETQETKPANQTGQKQQ